MATTKLTKEERIAKRVADRVAIRAATRAIRRAVDRARAKEEASNPLRLFDRGEESTGIRIVYSPAGDDGHAPLDDYADPYFRAMETNVNGVTGFQYRPLGEDGQVIPHDYSIVLRAATMGTPPDQHVISWAYIPVADETVTAAKMQDLLDEQGAIVYEADGTTPVRVPQRDKDGNIKYRAPTVDAAVNPVIDAMLDAMKTCGLVYAYWKSLAELEADTSAEAVEVKAAWPVEWVIDGQRTMLQIS